jgi:MFS family permease
MLVAVWLACRAADHTVAPTTPQGADRVRTRVSALLDRPELRWFALNNFLIGAALFGVLTHQVAMLQEAGWSAVSAAAALGVVNVLRSLAGPCWGMAIDRYRAARVFAISTAFSLLGLGLLMLLPVLSGATDLLIAVFTLAFGIGMAGSLPANASLSARLFAPAQRAVAWGLIDAAFAAGGALGAWSVGWLFDVSGNYVSALALVAALLGAVYCIICSLDRMAARADAP